MSLKNRHDRIVSLVNQHGYLSVSEISRRCDISVITIRRDLIKLDMLKRIKRTHGGATALQPPPDWSMLSPAHETSSDTNLGRFNAVILTCVETSSEETLMDLLKQKEIPIIAESVPTSKAVALVSVNNEQAAFQFGKSIGENWLKLKKEPVSLLDFTYPLPNTQARSHGFQQGLETALGYKPVRLVINAQSREENAYQLTIDALHTNPGINLVFTVNDTAAVGAMRAFLELGLDGDQIQLAPFGLEGSPVCQALADGVYCQSALAMFPEIAGTLCMDAACNVIHGIKQPPVISTPGLILTSQSLHEYYYPSTAGWRMRPEKWLEMMQNQPGVHPPLQIETPEKLRVGFTLRFRYQDWYQSLVKSMHTRANELGLELEVIDADLTVREELEQMEQKIARQALREIQPGQTIALDGGNISQILATLLDVTGGVTVVTNSLRTLKNLQKSGKINLIVPGGFLKPESDLLSGPAAESAMQTQNIDIYFLEAQGIHASHGISVNDMARANLTRAMLRKAKKTIVLAPPSALGLRSQIHVASIQSVHRVIAGNALPASQRAEITRQGVEVFLVN